MPRSTSCCFYFFIPVMAVWEHTGLCFNLCFWKLNSCVHGGWASLTHTQLSACSLLGCLCSFMARGLQCLTYLKAPRRRVWESCEIVCVFTAEADECYPACSVFCAHLSGCERAQRAAGNTINLLWTFSLCCCVELNNSCVITWWLVAQLLNQGRNMKSEWGVS